MGVITTEHLDDSELTEEELTYWRPRIRDGLTQDYIARITALHESREYPNTDEGWRQLKERAWAETISTSEVCRTISAISAKRRTMRMIQDGSLLNAVLAKPMTRDDVEAMLRAANPRGELVHLDGSEVTDEQIDVLVDVLNDPERRNEMLKMHTGSYEHNRAIANIVYRMRLRKGAPASQPPSDEDQLAQSWWSTYAKDFKAAVAATGTAS